MGGAALTARAYSSRWASCHRVRPVSYGKSFPSIPATTKAFSQTAARHFVITAKYFDNNLSAHVSGGRDPRRIASPAHAAIKNHSLCRPAPCCRNRRRSAEPHWPRHETLRRSNTLDPRPRQPQGLADQLVIESFQRRSLVRENLDDNNGGSVVTQESIHCASPAALSERPPRRPAAPAHADRQQGGQRSPSARRWPAQSPRSCWTRARRLPPGSHLAVLASPITSRAFRIRDADDARSISAPVSAEAKTTRREAGDLAIARSGRRQDSRRTWRKGLAQQNLKDLAGARRRGTTRRLSESDEGRLAKQRSIRSTSGLTLPSPRTRRARPPTPLF